MFRLLTTIEPKAARMYIDHFGGKSLSRQTRDWLAAAADDAEAKAISCAKKNPHGQPCAHEKMWNGLARDYRAAMHNRKKL